MRLECTVGPVCAALPCDRVAARRLPHISGDRARSNIARAHIRTIIRLTDF
jgi:hypothetical protein